MASYSIGEMEELTGIKAHVLRYWEEVIPSLAPKKDLGGRRSYSQRAFQTVMRLKYVIQERRFTIEGAGSEMIAEAGAYVSPQQELASALETIAELRSSLTELFMLVKKYRKTGGTSSGLQ